MKIANNIFLILIFMLTTTVSASAFELDLSVDEDIRKNYNPSKLENSTLPDLPKTLKTETNNNRLKQTQQPNTGSSAVPKTNIETDFAVKPGKVDKKNLIGETKSNSYAIKIPKGTKFKVKSQTNIGDWHSNGTRMTFVSTEPVTKRYMSFPAGTTIKASIEKSHRPGLAGNGGLIKIKADKLINNGNTQAINAKVIRANNKKIFFNNIKGKRGYWEGITNTVDKGQRFYTNNKSLAKKMSADGAIGTVLSPVPIVIGAVGLGVSVICSPVTGLLSKGSHISLPAGTAYTLKLREDSYIYK